MNGICNHVPMILTVELVHNLRHVANRLDGVDYGVAVINSIHHTHVILIVPSCGAERETEIDYLFCVCS